MASTATERATLNDLPTEMVCEVLSRLSLQDLVRFKMTAKRYLEILSVSRVNKLKVGVHEMSNSIERCQPNLFALQFARPTLSHLQHLTIDAHPNPFNLNELNRLTRLAQLKISCELPNGDPICLDLPDLRQLEVACNGTREMRINSTKLEKLTYYGDEDLLQVKHPETVGSLDSDLPFEHLRSFRNVRHLRSSSRFHILDERTLLDFPNLKEIAFTGTFLDVYYASLPYLERFMTRKKALGRADLKVQLVSLELVDHKPIDDYRFSKIFSWFEEVGYNYGDNYGDLYDYEEHKGFFYLLRLHVHNYDQLIGTAPIRSVSYIEIMQLFRGRIPDDFFSKFGGIKRVSVPQLYAGEEHLLWFLQSVPELKEFESHAVILSESFFHRLAQSCSKSLRSISLYEVELKRLQNLDFSGEFKVLSSLSLNMDSSLEEIRWLLNMSWHSKREFDLLIMYDDPKSKNYWPVEYGVMRDLDEGEAFLYRIKDRWTDCLKTCSLACLGELVEYFENL